MNIDYEVAELKRKFSTLFSVGVVTQMNDDDTKAKVRFGDIETGFLRILARKSHKNKDFWPYDKNEQVLVLALDGELSQGVIIGTLPKDEDAPKKGARFIEYEDGTSLEYDKKAHELRVKMAQNGKIKVSGASLVSLEAQNVEVKANKEAKVTAPSVILNDESGGGVITKNCTCAFTGGPHPVASTKVKASL